MRKLFVLSFVLSVIACGQSDHRPEIPSSNPIAPSAVELVQRGQLVAVGGVSLSGAEVIIIDAERLEVLARTAVNEQGGFRVSVPQRPSYWLGVFGPNLATYIDTAFTFTGKPITVHEARAAAGKATQAILGDVNNDDQVDIEDALLVLLYTLEGSSFVAPNQGNIALGDVNGDGQIDRADVLLIMAYVANPIDPTLPTGLGAIEDLVERDRAVLLVFYEATDGDNWHTKTHWRTSRKHGDWTGIGVDNNGRVAWMNLNSNRLNGPIPDALGQLDQLLTLNLSNNELTGTIPDTLGQLNYLQNLDLSNNELTGTIPDALGQLSDLGTLNLSNNGLTGAIPDGLKQLNNLQSLYLGGNELTGCIPAALGRAIKDYEHLELSVCDEIGAIEDPIDRDWAVLLALYEATDGDGWNKNSYWRTGQTSNNWTGISIDNNGRVAWMNLNSNKLNGPIPDALGYLDKLLTLNLSGNKLKGPIPESLGQLNELENLDLSNNELTGAIPDALGQLNYLQTLNLSNNGLTGAIPDGLKQLNNLQSLYLGGNELTGCIPAAWRRAIKDYEHLKLSVCDEIGAIEDLVDRDWAVLLALYEATDGDNWNKNSYWRTGQTSNNWTGIGLANNGRVAWMNLNSNRLNGPIPDALGQLDQLLTLNLSNNRLKGAIPDALGQLNVLENLDLSNNELTGAIPDSLGQLNYLQTLNLSNNRLTGAIPDGLKQLNSLQSLYLGGNELTGCIPAAWGRVIKDYEHLKLPLCDEIGAIEDPIDRDWAVLLALYEATDGDNWNKSSYWRTGQTRNNWTGIGVANNGRVAWMNLNSNRLNGPIPDALGYLDQLLTLNLSNNRLKGRIPDVLGQLNVLENLDLRNNELTGAIPDALGQLNSLQSLYLGGNELTGCIPAALKDVPNNDFDELEIEFCQ